MGKEITFTGTSPPGIRWSRKELLWGTAILVPCIVWSYQDSSFIPMAVFMLFSAFALISKLPPFQTRIYIKVSDGALSIRKENSLLWKSLLKDITSIELEQNPRAMPGAILIRNDKNDSYYLPLNGVEFDGMKPAELVDKLIEIKTGA